MADKSLINLKKFVQSTKWFWAFVISLLVCLFGYLINTLFFEVQPNTAWGYTYGTGAAVLMVGAALWGIRRRTMSFSPARSLHWVQFHVYGGNLALLLVLMHIGFRFPAGTLNCWLLILTLWISASGLFGVFLQKTIPRVLTSGLSIEVNYNRIPELIDDLRQRAETIVGTSPQAIQDFFKKNLAAALAGRQFRFIYFLDITGGIQSRLKQFEYLSRFLSAEEKQTLDQLKTIYRAKLEMDAHYTLQTMLRVWLFFHAPVSLVLLLLLGFHLYSVLYY